MNATWTQASGDQLEQGDYLPRCLVPVIPADFPKGRKVLGQRFDVLIITQSCDLENSKVRFVATVAAHSIEAFERINPQFAKAGKWGQVAAERVHGLRLLPSPTDATNARAVLVVDFRVIHSLPFDYLTRYAASLNPRWRLLSPHREKLSRAFGDFFSRVATSDVLPKV